MKKFVFASVMALASLSLVPAHTLRAQDSGAISIKDPAEYNAYQMANSQTDPKAKAAAMEDFLTKYPQTVLKKAVLGDLLRTYQGLGQPDQALGAATRILQVEPDNLEAIYTSVFIKKGQCAKTSDPQTCDDMAALAQKGLNAQKPAGLPDDQWKAQTDAVYPPFHSALALADLVSKKDPAGAVEEYRKELGMYADTTKGAGLVDTLQLATAEEKLQLADAQAARDVDAKVKATPGDATLTAAAKAAADKAAQDNIQAI